MNSKMSEYAIALRRAIEAHCSGDLVDESKDGGCPRHAKMLNRHAARSAEITDVLANMNAQMAEASCMAVELDSARASAMEAEGALAAQASVIEEAYGLLWTVITSDRRLHAARHLLLGLIDKDGQKRGIEAARKPRSLE